MEDGWYRINEPGFKILILDGPKPVKDFLSQWDENKWDEDDSIHVEGIIEQIVHPLIVKITAIKKHLDLDVDEDEDGEYWKLEIKSGKNNIVNIIQIFNAYGEVFFDPEAEKQYKLSIEQLDSATIMIFDYKYLKSYIPNFEQFADYDTDWMADQF